MFKKIKELCTFDKQGREILDQTPVAIPAGLKRPPTLQEQIQRAIRSEALRNYAQSQGQETFEEAEDFDVGDDFDPRSPWEEEFEGQFDHDVQLERKLQAARKAPKKQAEEKPKKKAEKKSEAEETEVAQ